MPWISTLAYAAFGGFAINVIDLWEDRKKKEADRVPKDVSYWVWWLLWPGMAVGYTWIVIADGNDLHPMLALTTGLTIPSVLTRIIQAGKQSEGSPTNSEP